MLVILFSFSPEKSKATVVFSKVGSLELSVIASISNFAISIPF